MLDSTNNSHRLAS